MAQKSGGASKPTLFSLPAEIRNKIFTLAVVHNHSLRAKQRRHLPPNPYTERGLLALTRICRQARDGVLPIFYGNNVFELDPDALTPSKWYYLASKSSSRIDKHLKKIMIFAIELQLELHDEDTIKIKYLGMPEGLCTCELEGMARDCVARVRGIGDKRNSLFLWTILPRRYGEMKVRCECGKLKRW